MIINANGCSVCQHREVCKYREQREKLQAKLEKVEMPTPFTLDVDCAHFDNSMTITTNPITPLSPYISTTGTGDVVR